MGEFWLSIELVHTFKAMMLFTATMSSQQQLLQVGRGRREPFVLFKEVQNLLMVILWSDRHKLPHAGFNYLWSVLFCELRHWIHLHTYAASPWADSCFAGWISALFHFHFMHRCTNFLSASCQSNACPMLGSWISGQRKNKIVFHWLGFGNGEWTEKPVTSRPPFHTFLR